MYSIPLCPSCLSNAVRRSQRKGWVEKLLCALSGVLPYRCQDCYARFFAKGR